MVLTAFFFFSALAFADASASSWNIEFGKNYTKVFLGSVLVLSHTSDHPAVFLGHGNETINDHHGNFMITDYVTSRIPLPNVIYEKESLSFFSKARDLWVLLSFIKDGDWATLEAKSSMSANANATVNRLWLRLVGSSSERIYGGGEQFSFLNLKYRRYPIWTREQGIGRNKHTFVTFQMDAKGYDAGGHYHTTYWPQLTFTSTRGFAVTTIKPTGYAVMDFRPANFTELEFWGVMPTLHFRADPSLKTLTSALSARLGRQEPLPAWVRSGAILGVQGGTERVKTIIRRLRDLKVPLAGIWIQDWAGSITTSFGSRVFWNWETNEEHYPELDALMKDNLRVGTRFLAYVNPHLNTKGALFKTAEAKGYFMRRANGSTYVQNFGGFDAGTIDLTNPAAYKWYKEVIIKQNMILAGFSGWMADFSEYTPVDAYFHDGSTGGVAHNRLPLLWAKINREAIDELKLVGKVFFFMRAGTVGSGNYSMCAWAGDQNVDWSWDDGLASTIPAALSLGMSGGSGLSHFDIGGYTSIWPMVRSEELLLRSAELAVFTPVMRTHESNVPANNTQIYNNNKLMEKFRWLLRIFQMLGNYTDHVMMDNKVNGTPAQRPLFLHYPADAEAFKLYDRRQWQFMYGPDLLVAPVLKKGVVNWRVYLPGQRERWIYIWSGVEYFGSAHVWVKADIGYPPMFYRTLSPFHSLFEAVGRSARKVNAGQCTEQRETTTYLATLFAFFLIFHYSK